MPVNSFDDYPMSWTPDREDLKFPLYYSLADLMAVSYTHLISVFIGGGQAETDICTCEGYRRKGFAMACASAFIDECLSRGLFPAWSCWPFRTESAALARKLGFEEKGAADAHFWAENM